MIFTLLFSLVLVGSLFATFYIFAGSFFKDFDKYIFGRNDVSDDEEKLTLTGSIFIGIYLLTVFAFGIMSLTKPIHKSRRVVRLMILFFGTFILITFAFSFNFFLKIYDSDGDDDVLDDINFERLSIGVLIAITLVCTWLMPLPLSGFKMNPFRYVLGSVCLVFLMPMYINIVIIYSIANLHDISWGNRETDDSKGDKTKQNLEVFRAKSFLLFTLVNICYGYGMVFVDSDAHTIYLLSLMVLVTFTVVFKVVLATIYT